MNDPGGGERSAVATAFFAAPLAAGFWVVAWVEALSALGLAGSRAAWALFWATTAAVAVVALAAFRRALRERPVRPPPGLAFAVPGAVLAATFVVALAAAPNNWDSMVYHNARVMEWWDHGSVAPWDTPSERQLRMPPLASYFKLALLGLTGNDVLFNIVQWAFFAFSISAAGILAARLVPSDRAGPWAALLAATIPMAILQSTSTQNDVVVAGYLLAAAFFLVRAFAADGAPARDLAFAGAAVGLGLATKGTAYLFFAVLLASAAVAALVRLARRNGAGWRAWAAGLAAAGVLGLLANVGFWRRNAGAFGSPLASFYELVRPADVFGAGAGRAAALGVSQAVRAADLQLGQLRLVGLEGAVLGATRGIHRTLGLSVDDPAISSTFPFARMARQPLNHEDTAPSTATFLVLAGTTLVALARRSLPGRRAVLFAFAWGWSAWLVVALGVRWMPWNARLQLPALLLLAVPAGAVLATGLGRLAGAALTLLLVVQALPALLLNSSRPLVGVSRTAGEAAWWRAVFPHAAPSIFATSRWQDYFRNRPEMQGEVEDVMRAVGRRCAPGDSVRLDLADGAWEYALWAGARRYAPGVHLRTGSPATGDVIPCVVMRSACPGGRPFCLDEPTP